MTIFPEVRVARKRHTPGCQVCHRPIEVGETYARWSTHPNDDMLNQTDHWSHIKAHFPYRDCPTAVAS